MNLVRFFYYGVKSPLGIIKRNNNLRMNGTKAIKLNVNLVMLSSDFGYFFLFTYVLFAERYELKGLFYYCEFIIQCNAVLFF